jgi:hypothetical protein
MKTIRGSLWTALIFAILVAHGFAQPPLPTNYSKEFMALDSWQFPDTNWLSILGYAPVSFTNLVNATDAGDRNALLLDTTNSNPAFLLYNVIETDGTTNINCQEGSLTFWFNPNWSGTNQGGTGPGDWANFVSLGQWGTNGSSWWALYASPDGSTIYFAGQTNGGSPSTYLSAPVSFTANTWMDIALIYGPTNSALYTNGVLVTNGSGVAYWPGSDVTLFAMGSDTNGFFQARGMFGDWVNYGYQLSDGSIAANFEVYSILFGIMPPTNDLRSAPSSPTNTPTFQAITGTGYLQAISTNTTGCASSSNIWITNVVATPQSNGTMNVTFTIAGGSNGVPYDVFANPIMAPASNTNYPWAWMGQGYQCVTYTVTNLPNAEAFLILGTPLDSDGDGLTDAYERLVSKTDPHNPDTGGSGVLDGWSVLWGLNPRADPSSNPNERSNYSYDPVGRLDLLFGARSENLTNDFEGNLLEAQ